MFEVDATQPPSQLFPAGLWLTAIETIRNNRLTLNPEP
jgi:hypothetical protein